MTNTFVAVGADTFIDRYSGERAAFIRDAAGRVQSPLYDGDDKRLKIAQ